MSDQQPNPYIAPQSDTDLHQQEEFAEVKFLSAKGRIGRIRLIAYSVGANFFGGIILAAAAALAIPLGEIGGILIMVAYIAVVVLTIVLVVLWTVRRLNDCNMSGWFTFIFILPLINLALWFIPGTHGRNNYGAMPPPNKTGVILLALVLPIIAVIGILAAIAIPAYQDFTIRARIQEGINISNVARAGLGTACADGYLNDQSENKSLGLEDPLDYGSDSTIVKSVAAQGLDQNSALVVVTFRQLGNVPEDAQIIYFGECAGSAMTWSVSADAGMPEKFTPRI